MCKENYQDDNSNEIESFIFKLINNKIINLDKSNEDIYMLYKHN